MKKIIYIFLLIGLSLTSKAQLLRAELLASGLTCSMCSFAIEKSLNQLSFIDSITSDLDHTTYILHFNSTKVVDINLIKKKVEDAGSSVASLILVLVSNQLPKDANLDFTYHQFNFRFDALPDVEISRARVIKAGFLSKKELKNTKSKKGFEALNSFDLKVL